MTNEEIISKLPYSKPFLFVDEIKEINENGWKVTLLSMKT
jgi:3-hydroxyacyl-[acyl-carrier-protein] dehydratase